MDRINVLVFPCGSEIALEIYRSLSMEKYIELYGLSSTPNNHGAFVFENYHDNFPSIFQSDFIEKLNRFCEEYHIDFIYPAHDDVLMFLSENREKLNARVINSNEETAVICRSKRATYRLLSDTLRVPLTFELKDLSPKDFPVFVKPDKGEGSRGARRIDDLEDLHLSLKNDPSLLICEYLPGSEYTVDCFTDRHGMLKYAAPRVRARTKSGIAVRSEPCKINGIEEMAEKINDKLKMRGVWFFQVKKTEQSEIVLMEVANRVAGTMEVDRVLGVNLPLLALWDALDMDVQLIKNNFHIVVDRALEGLYKIDVRFSRVYVDFDDTLVIQEQVNVDLVSFLLKCLNKGKRLILLTKHLGNLEASLKRIRLAGLFDEIIHIEPSEDKAAYVSGRDSIFIDDSFSDRKNIFLRHGIPVFAPDAVRGMCVE